MKEIVSLNEVAYRCAQEYAAIPVDHTHVAAPYFINEIGSAMQDTLCAAGASEKLRQEVSDRYKKRETFFGLYREKLHRNN